MNRMLTIAMVLALGASVANAATDSKMSGAASKTVATRPAGVKCGSGFIAAGLKCQKAPPAKPAMMAPKPMAAVAPSHTAPNHMTPGKMAMTSKTGGPKTGSKKCGKGFIAADKVCHKN